MVRSGLTVRIIRRKGQVEGAAVLHISVVVERVKRKLRINLHQISFLAGGCNLSGSLQQSELSATFVCMQEDIEDNRSMCKPHRLTFSLYT
jgi:hypothetical protein